LGFASLLHFPLQRMSFVSISIKGVGSYNYPL
jgi:hypothetical protein